MAAAETLIQLFIAFAKIGFTSFGGTSMIPLIMDEMSFPWLDDRRRPDEPHRHR